MKNLSPTTLVDEAIARARIAAGCRILVAVSGGADSMALLHALHRGSPRNHWTLKVGHIHHGLRGEESDADEVFVRQMADDFGLEAEVRSVDTMACARDRHVSLETAARELRYSALHEMLRAWEGDVIAVAHTEDDQAETLLLHLLRGSGLDGLSGMAPRHGVVVRPFLTVSRETITGYLREHGVGYRVDSSNLETKYRRNWVRHEVVPVLRATNPSATVVLARAARLLRSDAEYLRGEAERVFELAELTRDDREVSVSRGVLRSIHEALRRDVLRLTIGRCLGNHRDVELQHVRRLEALVLQPASVGRLEGQLPRGLQVYVNRHTLVVRIGAPAEAAPFVPVTLRIPGETVIPGGVFTAELLSPRDDDELRALRAVHGPLHLLCDAETVGESLLVRPRQPGDRIRPVGGRGSRTVQDVLVDAHVPRGERNCIPVVEAAQGIIWIPGVVRAEDTLCSLDRSPKVHLRFMPNRAARRH